MEEQLKALEGVVARLENLTGAKQEGSLSKVTMVMIKNEDQPHSIAFGGVFPYITAAIPG